MHAVNEGQGCQQQLRTTAGVGILQYHAVSFDVLLTLGISGDEYLMHPHEGLQESRWSVFAWSKRTR
eukprot:2711322-Pyramimonas_sp.AAC.1